jgi:hypothetical protein
MARINRIAVPNNKIRDITRPKPAAMGRQAKRLGRLSGKSAAGERPGQAGIGQPSHRSSQFIGIATSQGKRDARASQVQQAIEHTLAILRPKRRNHNGDSGRA